MGPNSIIARYSSTAYLAMEDVKVMMIKQPALILALVVVAALGGIGSCTESPSISSFEPEIGFLGAESDSDPKSFWLPAIFSFGSSVADTGTGVLTRTDSPASRNPYGITFPGYASGRWSDGRLLIDLWSKALGLPYLDPFIKSVTSSFRQGANFASAGGTATEKYTSSSPSSFNLALQLYQFRKFKSEVLAANGDGASRVKDCASSLPAESCFRDGLYVVAVGANDIQYPLENYTPIEEMRAAVPDISAAIMSVVEGLYEEGARNILVENVYPLACLPANTKVNYSVYGDMGALDSDGCVKLVDDLVLMHNSLLKEEIVAFSQRHSPGVSIALVDTYTIRRDLMINPVKHGFKDGVTPCCGTNGTTGYRCGENPRVQVCTDPSEYVVWDGLHYTEAANIATMNTILSGAHFYPNFSLSWRSCANTLQLADLAG